LLCMVSAQNKLINNYWRWFYSVALLLWAAL